MRSGGYRSNAPWKALVNFSALRTLQSDDEDDRSSLISLSSSGYFGNIVGCEAQIIENLLESSGHESMRRMAAWVGLQHAVCMAINGR
jgi:hypothetical protein